MNTTRRRHTFMVRDLAEIIIGSLVLAFPASFAATAVDSLGD